MGDPFRVYAAHLSYPEVLRTTRLLRGDAFSVTITSLRIIIKKKIHAYGNSRNISAEHRRTGKALLAIAPDDPTRIISTDKKAAKAGGLCLALKGVPVKPTDEVDVDKTYELIPTE